MSNLGYVAIYLSAAILCVALMKRLGFAAVLGYLTAGILIGPAGFRLIDDVENVSHIAEFGVVLLLFVIGLELQPSRLRALRRPVFGMGTAQMVVTGSLLTVAALAFGLATDVAAVVGFGLAMSSTAFVLQLLAEKRELGSVHGRAGFSILLLQDFAVIPMLTVVPLLASDAGMDGVNPLLGLLRVAAIVALLILFSRWVLRPLFHLVAQTGVPELFTATALLVVVATTLLMEAVGISVTLGAFLAGVLLADSEYRHEIEARVAPFEGLLLGLFFISVGMMANLALLAREPLLVAGIVAGFMALKFGAMYGLARAFRMPRDQSLKLAAALCQGGEFAYILFGLARSQGLMSADHADLLVLAVTLSMAATPFVYALAERITRRTDAARAPYDAVADTDHRVVIAGFGRFGQICGRILRALRVPFTALDINPDQIALVRRFGSQAYYGDASSLELLEAARVDKAQVFVLAIDDPAASVRTAEIVRRHFPEVRVLARARNRQHAFALMNLDVQLIERELYHSSLRMTEHLLSTLGFSSRQSKRAVISFRNLDEAALRKQHELKGDEAKLVQSTKEVMAELQALFESDSRLNPGAR
jgi:glutathione-regulated potassium-efflux system ancillary protein KefC/glutathione-regulated potassium-efflux system protein KefB